VSILTNRVLLRKSDSIAVMPYHVALDDVELGLLAILPVKLKSIESPVGAILRAPGELPPAASAFLGCLRLAAKDVPKPRLSGS
jgi:DNA-binding transcriptional LysR family regulator